MEALDGYTQRRSIFSPCTSLVSESSIFEKPGMILSMGSEGGRFSSGFLIDNLCRSDPLNSFFDLKNIPHQSFFHQAPFLPRSITNQPHCGDDMEFDLLGVNTYLNTMKLFVLVVSNNFGDSQMDSLFDWLSRDHTARSILSRLLRQNLVSMKVCAEKLILPAVRHRDRSTLTLLISLGVDLNTRQYLAGGVGTAIHCAVKNQYPEIVDLLLENGANDWRLVEFSKIENLVDFVVHYGHITMLEKLLDCELRILGSHQLASVETLKLAISENRPELLIVIARRRPELWESAKQKPWVLFEAAAFCEGTTMVDVLAQEGLDVRVSDGRHGSPLAVASAVGNTELVRYFLAAGIDLENMTVMDTTRVHGESSALELAVRNGHIDIARLLLQHGADVNEHRKEKKGSLLQLAAYSGNSATVKLLVEFGAKIDFSQREHPVSDDMDDDMNNDMDDDFDDYKDDYKDDSFNDDYEDYSHLPAIHIALTRRRLDVVKAFHDAGTRFASLRADQICHICYFQPYNCPVFHNEVNHEAENTRSDKLNNDAEIFFGEWWDPWMVAIHQYSMPDLRRIVHKKLISHPVTTAHISACIMWHGSSFTQESFHCDLLSEDLIIDPLLLCALIVHDDEEDMAKRMASRLIRLLGNNVFVQRYGIKALMLSARTGKRKLVKMFLDFGVDPFASEPSFHLEDLWRQDRFEQMRRYHKRHYYNGPSVSYRDLLPVEWVLHPICSTAFQTACIADDTKVIDLFATWTPKVETLATERNRKLQLSAAYFFSICSGDEALEQRILSCGITLEVASASIDSSMIGQYLHFGLRSATAYPRSVGYPQRHRAHRLLDMEAHPDLDNYRVSKPRTLWGSPLVNAVQSEDIGLIIRLLSLGANVNATSRTRGTSETTAVQIAAINGNFEILDLLVQAGGDLNAPPSGDDGRTALEGAAEWGRVDMTSYLLSRGADVEGRNNKNYRRAIYRAWKNGHRILARMIQQWKAEHHGEDGCDAIENIMETVTNKELRHW
jgi:ankyrin repeat protein